MTRKILISGGLALCLAIQASAGEVAVEGQGARAEQPGASPGKHDEAYRRMSGDSGVRAWTDLQASGKFSSPNSPWLSGRAMSQIYEHYLNSLKAPGAGAATQAGSAQGGEENRNGAAGN